MTPLSKWLFLLPLAVLGWPVAAHGAEGTVIADSVLEFSDTQGATGWYYGYYDGDAPSPFQPADFEQLPQFSGGRWVIQEGDRGYYTNIAATTQHPNGTTTSDGRLPVEHWAVRRWISEVSGAHVIRGLLADNDGNAPSVDFNGVVGHIFLDGVEVFTHVLEEHSDIAYSIAVELQIGSVVDFGVEPRMGIDWTDSTIFTAQVVVPEPAAGFLVFLAAVLFSASRRPMSGRLRIHAKRQAIENRC